MTPSPVAPEDAGAQAASKPAPLASLIGSLVHEIQNVLSTGDVAELRRMRPGETGCAAYWKLASGRLDPSIGLSEDAERKWTVLVASLAKLAPLHRPGARLGRTLAEARVAEPRVLRLLRARGESLEDAVRILTHQVASSGKAVDCTDLARLILSDGRTDENRVRRSIARDFYSSTPNA